MKRVFQVILVFLVTTIVPVIYWAVMDLMVYPMLMWVSVLLGFIVAYITWEVDNRRGK